MSNKRNIILLLLLLSTAVGVQAERRRFVQNPANHFVTISLGGGEGNTISAFSIPGSKDLIGADALFSLGYELRKNKFFFGFGAEADFDITRQQLGDFVESEWRRDFENDAHLYSYRYSRFTDVQRNLQLGVPLYFGMYFGPYVYGTIGAKFDLSLWGTHTATTTLSTDGTYPRYEEPLTNLPRYGFYAPDTYSYTGLAKQVMKVGPTIEIGAKVPLYTSSRRVGLRMGLYAGYLFPLEFDNTKPLVDYSGVDSNPLTLNQQNLKDNIVFGSAIASPYQLRAAQNLAVGIKFTLLINCTAVHKICNCDSDSGIHPIRHAGSGGRIEK